MKFKVTSDSQRKIKINWDHINLYALRWKPGTEFEVEITRKQKKVSDPMRKYYFAAVLPPFMSHLGYDPEDQELFHRQLKIVYFQIEPDKKGIYLDVPSVFGNDSDMPISEKTKFLDWVIRKAAQEGCYIENPDE